MYARSVSRRWFRSERTRSRSARASETISRPRSRAVSMIARESLFACSSCSLRMRAESSRAARSIPEAVSRARWATFSADSSAERSVRATSCPTCSTSWSRDGSGGCRSWPSRSATRRCRASNSSATRRRKARTSRSSRPFRAFGKSCRSIWAGVSRGSPEPDGRGSSTDIGATVLGLRAGCGRWRRWDASLVAAEVLQLGEGIVEAPDARDLHPAGAAAGLLQLLGRDQEQFRSRLAGGHRLLLGAADGAHGAVAADGPGDRDLLAAGQVPGAELVQDREREREPGRRATDASGVDLDVHREVELLAAGRGLHAHLRAALARPLRRGAGRHRHGRAASVSIDGERDRFPGRSGTHDRAELVGEGDGLAVDGGGDVTDPELAVSGGALLHRGDDGAGPAHWNGVTEPLERDALGGHLGARHLELVEPRVLGAGSALELLVLLNDLGVVVQPARENRERVRAVARHRHREEQQLPAMLIRGRAVDLHDALDRARRSRGDQDVRQTDKDAAEDRQHDQDGDDRADPDERAAPAPGRHRLRRGGPELGPAPRLPQRPPSTPPATP